MNNVHLLCQNLHRIANLWVNPILRFNQKSAGKSLDHLVHSSRVFQELEFKESELLHPDVLFFNSLAPSIKILSIYRLTVDTKCLMDLINALPGLESIKLSHVRSSSDQIVPVWDIKSIKIKCLEINICSSSIASLMVALKDCVVQEVMLDYTEEAAQVTRDIFREFLAVHEKHLKKLTIKASDDFLSGLKDLQLEELHFFVVNYSLAFLKQYKGLQAFTIFESHVPTDTIWELDKLEKLELLLCWFDKPRRVEQNQPIEKLEAPDVHYFSRR